MSRPYTDVIRDINNGKFAEELTDQMAELVHACIGTGKAGTLVVTLKLKPAKGNGNVMTIEHESKLKAPDFDRPQQFFFVTNAGALVTENPHQRGLPFREVEPAAASEIRDVPTQPSGEIEDGLAAAH